jgi:hypothetical protein
MAGLVPKVECRLLLSHATTLGGKVISRLTTSSCLTLRGLTGACPVLAEPFFRLHAPLVGHDLKRTAAFF